MSQTVDTENPIYVYEWNIENEGVNWYSTTEYTLDLQDGSMVYSFTSPVSGQELHIHIDDLGKAVNHTLVTLDSDSRAGFEIIRKSLDVDVAQIIKSSKVISPEAWEDIRKIKTFQHNLTGKLIYDNVGEMMLSES